MVGDPPPHAPPLHFHFQDLSDEGKTVVPLSTGMTKSAGSAVSICMEEAAVLSELFLGAVGESSLELVNKADRGCRSSVETRRQLKMDVTYRSSSSSNSVVCASTTTFPSNAHPTCCQLTSMDISPEFSHKRY